MIILFYYELCSILTTSALQMHGIQFHEVVIKKIEENLTLAHTSTLLKKYRAEPHVKLCALLMLLEEISDLVHLIEPSLKFLLFLVDDEGSVLKKISNSYKIKCAYFTVAAGDKPLIFSTDRSNWIKLNEIVEHSEKHIFKLMHGESTFLETLKIFELEFLENEECLDVELHHIENYLIMKLGQPREGSHIALMKEGLLALATLFEIRQHLILLHETCEMYKLHVCLDDPEMKYLLQIDRDLSSEELHKDITLKNGIEMLTRAKEILKRTSFEDTLVFDLLSTIKHSQYLLKFCHSRGFASVDGYKRFIAEHKLVTISMEKEDYCEEILNQLRVAMLFVSPFFNHTSNLSQLMDDLNSLSNIPAGILQLQNVEANIDKIDVSFNVIEVCD